jgi:hypothetical protein
MKRLVVMGLLWSVLCMLWATSLFAQEKHLDGHWEGAITQPAGDVKIMADFTTESDTAKGTFSLPAAAIFQWPLRIVHASSNVKFRLPNDLGRQSTEYESQGQVPTLSGRRPG